MVPAVDKRWHSSCCRTECVGCLLRCLGRLLSLCADVAAIVGQSALAVVSHKQERADSGKVLIAVYNRRSSD